MTSHSAARRIPLWLLTVGSLGVTGYGLWSVTQRLTTMETVLLDQSATTADVYAGQSWVVVDAALVMGGLVGVFLALTAWTLSARAASAPAAEAPVTEQAVTPVAEVPAAIVAEPVNDTTHVDVLPEATEATPTR